MSDFTLATLEPQPFAYVTRLAGMREVGAVVSETFAVLSAAFAKANATPQGPPLAHFRPTEHDFISVDLGFPVTDSALDALQHAGLTIGETPAGQVMRGEHAGAYGALGETYDALLAAMREQGLTPAPDMWERYAGEGDDVRVEVIWPVAPPHAGFQSF